MELVMQTTEHQRVAILRKQRIATMLGEINVHVVGNGPAMVCWPSLLMTGQMWRGQGDPFASSHKMVLVDPPSPAQNKALKPPFPLAERGLCPTNTLVPFVVKSC